MKCFSTLFIQFSSIHEVFKIAVNWFQFVYSMEKVPPNDRQRKVRLPPFNYNLEDSDSWGFLIQDIKRPWTITFLIIRKLEEKEERKISQGELAHLFFPKLSESSIIYLFLYRSGLKRINRNFSRF